MWEANFQIVKLFLELKMSINKHSHTASMLKLNCNQIFVYNSEQLKDLVPHCLRKENYK